MPGAELTREVERQLTVCNACRYCEGYCAVWPSMELRRTFSSGDVEFLANVCFDCRDCFYACQYAPPHEFAINIPMVLAQVRTTTYQEYAWPARFGRLLRYRWGTPTLVSAGVLAALALTLVFAGPPTVFSAHQGPGSFYGVIPYVAMVVPFLLLGLYWLGVWAASAVGFWRSLGATPRDMVNLSALLRATGDAFGLTYLRGGGAGCNYPDERFSLARLWFHHLVFYGFLLDLASTSLAAVYDHVLGWQAPYPLLHPVVILGSVGGVGLLVGTAGLLYLKMRSDKAPAEGRMLGMDVAFLAVLCLVSATGMALLAVRETAAMGTLLAVHLGTVFALFVSAPYGKFAHLVYRYMALVRSTVEQRMVQRLEH